MESAFHAENVGFTPEMATCFSAKRHIFSFKYKKKKCFIFDQIANKSYSKTTYDSKMVLFDRKDLKISNKE